MKDSLPDAELDSLSAGLFIRASLMVSRILETEFDTNPNEGGLAVLYIALMRELRDHDLPMSEVKSVTGATRTTASRIVDRLVAVGVVERYENASDRRVVMVHMTEKGKHLFDSLWDRAIQCVLPLLSKLTAGERKGFSGVLQGLLAEEAVSTTPDVP